jgi:hypothetical protein
VLKVLTTNFGPDAVIHGIIAAGVKAPADVMAYIKTCAERYTPPTPHEPPQRERGKPRRGVPVGRGVKPDKPAKGYGVEVTNRASPGPDAFEDVPISHLEDGS